MLWMLPQGKVTFREQPEWDSGSYNICTKRILLMDNAMCRILFVIIINSDNLYAVR